MRTVTRVNFKNPVIQSDIRERLDHYMRINALSERKMRDTLKISHVTLNSFLKGKPVGYLSLIKIEEFLKWHGIKDMNKSIEELRSLGVDVSSLEEQIKSLGEEG